MKNPADAVNSFRGTGPRAGSIHPDLLSLILQVRACIGFTELTMAAAASDHREVGDFFILDDVTPHHAMVDAALNACHAALGEALCHLLEASISSAVPRVVRTA